MTVREEASVLIAGGGPVGLILALDLAQRNIRSIVIEQDAGTSLALLSKAGTYNERTMEYCRRLGVADEIADKSFPKDYPRGTVYCTTLDGFVIGKTEQASTLERGLPDEGPEMLQKCPQYIFDPVIAAAAIKTGLVDVRYSTEFIGFEQDDDGVSVEIKSLATGELSQVRASYVVGCDGAGSQVRKLLDIGFSGEQLDYSVSAMLRIKALENYHAMGKCERFMFIDENGTWANLTATDGHEVWRLTVVGSEDVLSLDKFDINEPVKRAFGVLDIPYEIEGTFAWRRSQYLAERYNKGRVFIAGDACHTTSPTGGHGVNTGIGDAMDLAWILEAQLAGWGGAKLAEAYGLERKPIAYRNFSSSTENYKVWTDKSGNKNILDDTDVGAAARKKLGFTLDRDLRQEWFSRGIGMGYRYNDSPVIIADGTPDPADDPTEYIQTARPGHRAPHVWVQDGQSSIDWYGKGFVLLRIGAKPIDTAELQQYANKVGMPLEVIDTEHRDMTALYERKLVLVRPDGHVAWRGDKLPASVQNLIDTVRGA